jgi:hypothetical protein
MKFSTKSIIFFTITCCICTFYTTCINAQTVKLNDKISFSVSNATIADALESLSRITGSYFSYNSDQVSSTRIVSVNLHDKSLLEVLDAILGASKFSYRQMGNQVIVYRNKKQEIEATAENDKTAALINNEASGLLKKPNANNTTVPSQIRPDTVIIYQQVHDTLIKTDTLVKTDTIISNVSTPVSGNDIFSNSVVLSKELTPVLKFDIGISAGFFIPHASYSATGLYSEKLTEYKNSFSNRSFSGSAGIDLKASYKKWSAATGVALTLFGQKLDYSYLDQTGGFYRKDTLDPYYTLIEGDTTWYYIVDSTYVPIDSKLYNYRLNNHFKYLEIPLTIQYNYGYHSVLFFAKAGVITGFFLQSDGQQILPDENGIKPVKDIKATSVIFSYTAGAGLIIPVARQVLFSTSVYYREHLSNIYKDFPVNTKFSAVGINIAVSYKLY